MEDKNFQFPIPNSVLEPYIKQAVAVAITSALEDGTKLVEHAVSVALSETVNSSGKASNYSSDNRYILAEVLAKNKIQEIARETVNEMAEQMRPKIKEQIENQLRNKHSLIAQSLVDGLIGSLTSR